MDFVIYHAGLTAKRYKYYRPAIEDMLCGTREMKVGDPFRNRIIFVSAGGEASSADAHQ